MVPESGEHQAFREELRDQSSASRAKRRAHGYFPPTRRAARHQQIRQIDACDQQQRRRRATVTQSEPFAFCPRSLHAEGSRPPNEDLGNPSP